MKTDIYKYMDSLVEVIFLYAAFLILCSTIFMFAEQQTFVKSLYWAFTTATSTGYGDITPKTNVGIVIAFLTMHLGVFFFAPLIVVRMLEKLIKDSNEFTHHEQEQIFKELAEIKNRLKDKTDEA